MEELQLSYFQQNMNNIISSVCDLNQPVVIKDKSTFLVKIEPILYNKRNNSWLGCMKGTGIINEDIVLPIEKIETWEVLSE